MLWHVMYVCTTEVKQNMKCIGITNITLSFNFDQKSLLSWTGCWYIHHPLIQLNQFKLEECNDVSFVALRCIIFKLQACIKSTECSAESGCKAKKLLSRYV